MARPLRLEFAGALYHVTSRGDGREDIYLSDEDRELWLAVFAQVCERFNWVCHAYCLMSNHYHLLLETPEGNLSAGMRQLNGVYTQRFNRTHARVGHVFQGRFKAIIVERDAYLLELARYIVLNPVRARMVKRVDAWPWSSYRATMGKAPSPVWLETRSLLAAFSARLGVARARYADFVRAGVGLPSVWVDLRGQMYLGSEAFLAQMQAMNEAGEMAAGRSGEVPRAHRRPLAAALSNYVVAAHDKAARNEAIRAAWITGDFTLQAIADAFSVHYATVSRVVSRRG